MRKGKHQNSKRGSKNVASKEVEIIDIYSSSKRKRRSNPLFDAILLVLFIIECIVAVGCTAYIAILNLLPMTYILILSGMFALIIGAQLLLKICTKKRNNIKRVFSLLLTIMILFGSFYGTMYLGTINSSIDEITDEDEEDEIIAPNAAKVTKEPFIIYLSGSDTRNYSNIPEKGLSDVNMIIAVDPVNYKILLVNTPRDYYVAMGGDENRMDKLTHAGNQGVECSMKSLEWLYDIEFNYYVKINFKSVVDIVDAVGGITVNSEYNFSSRHSLSRKTYNFVVGENKLNGDAALAFARERKSFALGDRQRGKHQQMVINAALDKVISPALLNPSKFSEILSAVTSNTKTNISKKEIKALFKMQLASMRGWETESIAADGTGMSINGIYYMKPDQETVDAAKIALAAYKK